MLLNKASPAQHDAKSCTACYSHRTVTDRLLHNMTKHSSALSKDPVSKPKNIHTATAAQQVGASNAQHAELAAVSGQSHCVLQQNAH